MDLLWSSILWLHFRVNNSEKQRTKEDFVNIQTSNSSFFRKLYKYMKELTYCGMRWIYRPYCFWITLIFISAANQSEISMCSFFAKNQLQLNNNTNRVKVKNLLPPRWNKWKSFPKYYVKMAWKILLLSGVLRPKNLRASRNPGWGRFVRSRERPT